MDVSNVMMKLILIIAPNVLMVFILMMKIIIALTAEMDVIFALIWIIAENARDYCRTLISKIENNGFKVGLTTLYVIGGGARIMRNFSDIGTVPGVNIIDDIHANAKGYANLAMQVMKRNKEK